MAFRLAKFWQGLPTWAVAVGITAVTLVLVGGIAMVTTPLGCVVSNGIGLKSNPPRCGATTAIRTSPTPTHSPVSTVTPTSDVTPSPVQSPSPLPSPTPTPAGPPYQFPASAPLPPFNSGATAPVPSNIKLSCRLPVYTGQPGSGGFVVFPGRTFVGDPKSAVSLPTPTPSPAPGPGQGYYGQYGLSYDRAFKVWVPVSWNLVAPDGAHYAWSASDGIYARTMSDGTVSELGEGHQWTILSVASDGVYATRPNVPGLWFLPYSGSVRQITTTRWWQAVGGGAAYGTDTSSVPQGISNVIIRLDIAAGTAKKYFETVGAQSQVVGFDLEGHPLIQTYSPNGFARMWLVTGIGKASVIGELNGPFSPNGPPLADRNGVWFGTYQSLILYIPNDGLYTMAAIGAQLAGTCA